MSTGAWLGVVVVSVVIIVAFEPVNGETIWKTKEIYRYWFLNEIRLFLYLLDEWELKLNAPRNKFIYNFNVLLKKSMKQTVREVDGMVEPSIDDIVLFSTVNKNVEIL